MAGDSQTRSFSALFSKQLEFMTFGSCSYVVITFTCVVASGLNFDDVTKIILFSQNNSSNVFVPKLKHQLTWKRYTYLVSGLHPFSHDNSAEHIVNLSAQQHTAPNSSTIVRRSICMCCIRMVLLHHWKCLTHAWIDRECWCMKANRCTYKMSMPHSLIPP